MVAIARPETGGKLRCWSFFAKSPDELFAGFVLARNRQDAECRANAKAKERQGVLLKLARFCEAEVDALQANGLFSLEWLTVEEIETVVRSFKLGIETKFGAMGVQVERLSSLVLKFDRNKRNHP